MPKIITKAAVRPGTAAKTKVAAYARVSSGKDAMLHSLSAQVSHYSDFIQEHDGWEYVGVYSDEAMTGTKEDRDDFQRLLADCRAGKIDMVITKSISRFARNTVTLLETVRMLKSLGVDVYFEEQDIHTIGGDGELMLTILASYAQEESRSASENQKWRIKRNFEEGMPWNGALLGYRLADGQYEIVPDEADIVRRIYGEYLAGSGYSAIAKGLNEDGIPSRFGGQWRPSVISKILRNTTYTGNLILQKTFRENHITKKTVVNNGQLPKYAVENAHEAIIDARTFEKVQSEINRRSTKYGQPSPSRNAYPFTGLLECANCGKHYRRKTTAARVVWICATYNTLGKKYCAAKQIPEETLMLQTRTVTDDISAIQKIQVANGNVLRFVMKDGRVIVRQWEDRSRADSWSPEMREAARQRTLNGRKSECQER